MSTADVIVCDLLEANPQERYRIASPSGKGNPESASWREMWAYKTYNIVDSATVEGGKYRVVFTDLHYLDAMKVKRILNTEGEDAEDLLMAGADPYREFDKPSDARERDAAALVGP